MCYAIPGRIVELKGKLVVVDYFGERKNCANAFSELKLTVGDYVYAQGGIVISKLGEKEAVEILKVWREKFFELKEKDGKISKDVSDFLNSLTSSAFNSSALSVLQKVNLGKELSFDDLLLLSGLEKTEELSNLFGIANAVRQKENGNSCCVHGIIEFSNYCKNNCHYCGIRKDSQIERFRMTESEIIETAKMASEKYGFKALVLQSGEDLSYSVDVLKRIVSKIKSFGVLVFLSIGVRPIEEYAMLYSAGARGILLRFETTNEQIFSNLRPGTSFQERIDLIRELKVMGFVVATGFIVGLPGETNEDLVRNILLTKKLGADMYSFGPLIPTVGTPLEKEKKVSKEQALKAIAISRLFDPQAKILVTTALETLDEKAKKEALLSGGNSLMINVTPKVFKEKYCIYDGKAGSNDGLEEIIEENVSLLYSLGRAPTDLGV